MRARNILMLAFAAALFASPAARAASDQQQAVDCGAADRRGHRLEPGFDRSGGAQAASPARAASSSFPSWSRAASSSARRAALMLQGTGSDVGKSLIVAGLARALDAARPRGAAVQAAEHVEQRRGDRGWRRDRPRPGAAGARLPRRARGRDEPGAAEAADRSAARSSSSRAASLGTASAREYQALKRDLLPRVLRRFERLADEADLVLVEGAGSAAEINLRAGDIANMGFAEAADVPVVLVGDIERGGVIARSSARMRCSRRRSARCLKGYIVNKFRGDARLFDGGIERSRRAPGLPASASCRGSRAARDLPAEDCDGARAQLPSPRARRRAPHRRAAPAAHRQFRRSRSARGRARRRARTRRAGPAAAAMRSRHPAGLEGDARRSRRAARARAGTSTSSPMRAAAAPCSASAAAIRCSAARIADPDGIEGAPGDGAGPRPARCRDRARRRQDAARRRAAATSRAARRSPAMRCISAAPTGPGAARPMLRLGDRRDGAVSRDGRVAGCHLHGLFASDAFRRAFLARLGGAGDPALALGGADRGRARRARRSSRSRARRRRAPGDRPCALSLTRSAAPRAPPAPARACDQAGDEIEPQRRADVGRRRRARGPSPSQGSSTSAPP